MTLHRNFWLAVLPVLILAASAFATDESQGEEMSLPAIDVEMRGTTLLWAGSPHRQEVSLTFDDGPLPGKTEALLDILRAQDIHATFFVIGEKVKAHPELIRLMVNDGHEIGNHTYTHPNLTKVSSKSVYRELNDCQKAVESAVGFRPTIFRAPYGAANLTVFSYLSHIGLSAAFWSIDTRDWDAKSVQQVEDSILPKVKAGDVILFHEQSRHTVAALPNIIEGIRSKGLGFKTISGMFDLVQPTPPAVIASATGTEASTVVAKAEVVAVPVTVEEPAAEVSQPNEEKPSPAEAVAAAMAALTTPSSDASEPVEDSSIAKTEPQEEAAAIESTPPVAEVATATLPETVPAEVVASEPLSGAPAEPAPLVEPATAASAEAPSPVVDSSPALSQPEVSAGTEALTVSPEVVVLAPIPVTVSSDAILPEIIVPARPAEPIPEVSSEVQAPTLAYVPPPDDPLGTNLEKALALPVTDSVSPTAEVKKAEGKKKPSAESPVPAETIRLVPDKKPRDSDRPLTRLTPSRETAVVAEEPPVSPQKVRRLVPIEKPGERLVTPQATTTSKPTIAQPRPYSPRTTATANSKRLLPPPEEDANTQEASYRQP